MGLIAFLLLFLVGGLDASPSLENFPYCDAGYPLLANYTIPLKGARLVHLVLLARHGARSSVMTMPFENVTWDCDDVSQSTHLASLDGSKLVSSQIKVEIPEEKSPYGVSFWRGSCMVGQLTPKGGRQLLSIGKALRAIYADRLHFLPWNFDATTISVRSTDVPRTLQSANSLLSGLFGYTFPHFPIEVVPSQLDSLTGPPQGKCPKLETLMAKAFTLPEWRQHIADNKELLDRVYRILGLSNNKGLCEEILDAVGVVPHGARTSLSTTRDGLPELFLVPFDEISSRGCHGVPLPCNENSGECVTEAEALEVERLAEWEFDYMYRSNAFAFDETPLRLPVFLEEVKSNLKEAVKDDFLLKKQLRLHYYQAHDTTVAPFITALKPTKVDWPPFASNVLIELWQQKKAVKKYFVRVLYNGQPLAVEGGRVLEFEPLEDFIARLDDAIPEDINKACAL